MKRITTATAALCLLAAPALADTYDVSGTGQGKATSTPMPISDDLVVVHATTEYTGFEGAADNPMATLKGPCFGSVLVDKGNVSGGGHCQYTDADGEMAVISWEANGMSAEGRTMGSWALAGGSGKWATATGGGSFDAGTDAAGTYTNKVTGEVTLD
ncbi:MAG: hypothetical protein LJE62_03830 [Silicimonas sp.]|nr:hypothetical protein [Silicimonas sp.]